MIKGKIGFKEKKEKICYVVFGISSKKERRKECFRFVDKKKETGRRKIK